MSAQELASTTIITPKRVERLFEHVDYKLARTDEEKDEIFRLRYEAYLRENATVPNFSERLSDQHDESDNTFLFEMYIDAQLASTIRISVATDGYPDSPSRSTFPEFIDPALRDGKIIIDPTRHATTEKASREFPTLLPLLTTRIAWMAAEHFCADVILATVRTEHQAFYRRVFGCRVVCEARPYPQLTKPLSLMTLDFKEAKDRVQQRYPHFRSTRFERRMLFEIHDVATSIQSDPDLNDVREPFAEAVNQRGSMR